MKPSFVEEVSNEGNLGNESIEFTLDESSLAHLQSVLSDLYSNRELATLRELSTNAYDAHIEVGNPNPIKVTLPTNLNPVLVVQDEGVGMDVEDFRNIYTKYAASTKRDTNDQVGTLGLGSKAPLALVDSFSVVSVKNGVRSSALVFRNSKNIGELTVVETVETDEPSGTTITIPVDAGSIANFRDAAENLFQFWDEGTVLVDGEEPTKLECVQISDTFSLSYQINKDYLVMGNISYPVEIPQANQTRYGYYSDNGIFQGYRGQKLGIIMRVNVGDVDFTPSREALNYTKKTLNVVLPAREKLFEEALKRHILGEINNCATRQEALQSYLRWENSPFSIELPDTWNGVKIPHVFHLPKPSNKEQSNWKWRRIKSVTHNSYDGSRVDNVDRILLRDFDELPKTLMVTGYNSKNRPPTALRKRVKLWLANNSLTDSYDHVLFTEKSVNFDGWHIPEDTVSCETLKRIKLPRTTSAKKVGEREWNAVIYKQTISTSNTLAWEQKNVTSSNFKGEIVYASPVDLRKEDDRMRSFQQTVGSLFAKPNNAALVYVPTNQFTTFLKENPTAVHYKDWLKTVARELLKDEYTYEERVFWHATDSINWYRNTEASFKWLNPDKVDDPKFKQFLITLSTASQNSELSYPRLHKVRVLKTKFNTIIAEPDKVYEPEKEYPLLEYIRIAQMENVSGTSESVKDLYNYLNSKYAETLK